MTPLAISSVIQDVAFGLSQTLGNGEIHVVVI